VPRAEPSQIVVGVTGASGAPYARRLVDCLEVAGAVVHLVLSPYAKRVMTDELGLSTINVETLLGRPSDRVRTHAHKDLGAPIASGSFPHDGMIICPCSVHTMAAVASGLADNLVTRAAAVTLKETRKLVLVPREMPFSPIDLRNAVRCSQAGAIIAPAAPGFYMRPQRIDDLVDFVVGRLLDLVDVPHSLNTRWADRIEPDPRHGNET
jgi:4-hydroxy-3-polyprenylbenzoate decarboxylase